MGGGNEPLGTLHSLSKTRTHYLGKVGGQGKIPPSFSPHISFSSFLSSCLLDWLCWPSATFPNAANRTVPILPK